MKVDRQGKLVKWAYLLRHLNDEYVPHTTSICVLFWRCLVLTPIHVVTFLATVAGMGFMLIYPWIRFPFHNVLAIWAGIALVLLLIVWALEKDDYTYKTAGELDFISLVTGYYDSVRSKVCPTVTIERR